MREVVPLAKLLPQMRVLVDEPPLVLVDQPVDLDRLRDHRRDHAEELHAAVERALRIEFEVDCQRPHRAPVEDDGDADEAQFLVRELGTPRRAVQEGRLAADARHDDRLAALHDAPRDPLADLVADRARRVAHAVGGFDVQRAAGIEQRHEAADGAVLIR